MRIKKPGRHFFLRFAAFIFTIMLCVSVYGQAASARGLSLIRDAEIERVLLTIATPILEQAGFSAEGVRIIIVNNSNLNAFVVNSQSIFIHTGLILRAENPEEIAGVIAHEISHIASGHVVRTHAVAEGLSFQTLLTSLLGIAAAIGTGNSDAGLAIIKGGQAAALTNFLKHSRTQESAADHGAMSYLNGAGVSPKGLLSFMEKLESEELLPESQQSEYIRTHPLTTDRVNFLRRAVEKSRYKDKPLPRIWYQSFARVQAKLTGYLLPERALRLRNTTSLPSVYARSIALYRKGKIDESLALLDSLLEQEPQNGYFHELKGQILFEHGKVNVAAKSYAKAVALAPDDLIKIDYGHVLVEQARAAQSAGDTKKMHQILKTAIATLQQAKRQEEKNPRLFNFLAIAYGIKGQEGYARLNLAEEAVLKNQLDVAGRQLSYAEANLPKDASQARLRLQDLKQLVEQRRRKQKKK